MGILDRGGHQRLGLAAGIAEHDALIAGTVAVHTLGDMRRLLVQEVLDLQLFPVKLLLLITDILDAVAHDTVDAAHELLKLVLVRQPDFAANDHAVGGGEGLAGDPRQRLFGQKGIQNGVRNPVAHLVRVPLGDGFRGEDVVKSAHGEVLR